MGMQHFDGEIEKLVRAGVVDIGTGLAYATNPGNLRLVPTDVGNAPTHDSDAIADQPQLAILT